MKRCINWVINGFTNLIGRFEWQEIVGFAISGLLGIAIAIMIFVAVDKVPATPSDYEQIENQIVSIQQNPDLLLETDCNININSGAITVEFENDECKMTAKYDKDFEVLSTSKEDKSRSWFLVLLVSLILGAFTCYAGGRILAIVILFFQMAVEWIYEMVRKFKVKCQKQ